MKKELINRLYHTFEDCAHKENDNAGQDIGDHFVESNKMIEADRGATS